MKKILPVLLFLLSFLYLLCFPKQAAEGARDGLLLWYRSVLPVLFPFLLLCGLFLNFHLSDHLQKKLYRPFHALFGCSGYGALAIVTGFLCGFPMGARLTAELYRQNKISRKEALFLYGFVNNLSPVFILSYLSTDQLQLPRLGTAFLCTILGSAFLWGLISSIRFRREVPIPDDISQKSEDTALQPGDISQAFATIDATINDAILNIVRLGAYITVFSIISHALSTLADSSHPLLLVLVSCIEITNGIHLIAVSSLPLYIRYILLCSISAFGGFSALMQTISVAGMDRETIIAYIKSRVMITLLSTLLSIATVLFVFFLRLR